MKKNRFENVLKFFFLGIAAGLFLLHQFRIIDFHEWHAVDLKFRLRGAQPAHRDIVLVTIDDQSLASLGEWPWPRTVHAAFLEIISKFQPQAVFFDVLFTEASPDPEQDQRFRAAIQKSGNVVLPFFYVSEKPFQAQFAHPVLREAAAAEGYANVAGESDGGVRRAKAFVPDSNERFFAAPLSVFKLHQGKDPLEGLPLDREHRFWINYPGGMNSFQTISFREVITRAGTEQNDFLKNLFSGKIVFVGHTATGTTDLRPTPFSTQMPGVIVQASIMHTLLSRHFFQGIPAWAHFLLLILLSWASSALFKKLPPLKGFFAMSVILTGYFISDYLLFVFPGWVVPMYVPMAAIILCYGVVLFWQHAEIQFEKEFVQKEMHMAARIQNEFLPQTFPEIKNLEVDFETHFAKEVGGDLYDWVDLGEHAVGLCIGDVSGKGMPASLYMAKALSDFKSIGKANSTPGEIVAELNRILLERPASGMFLTFFYCVIDNIANRIRYASAGHELSLIFRNESGKVEMLSEAQGLPLGMIDGTYETAETAFEPGDVLLSYSDGVKELRNPANQEFGVENLKRAFAELAKSGKSSSEIKAALFKQLQEFQKTAPVHDDCTLLCVRFVAESAGVERVKS